MSGIPNAVAASALQSVQTQRVAGDDRNRRRAEETKPRNERADRLDLQSESANAVEAADAAKAATEDLPDDRPPGSGDQPADEAVEAGPGDSGASAAPDNDAPPRPRLDLQA